MTVLHTGSTKKYVAGWEEIFARRSAKGAATITKPAATAKRANTRKKTTKIAKRRPR